MNAPYWKSINLIYIKRLLVITYNIYYGNSVEPLNDLIVKPATTYNFRKSLNVEVLRPKIEVGRSSLQHRAALTWNLLPDDIKNSPNLATFKRKLKESKNILKSISFNLLKLPAVFPTNPSTLNIFNINYNLLSLIFSTILALQYFKLSYIIYSH